MQKTVEKLTDSELYKLAQDYGLRAKQWLRKFEGLLPEIYRRKLYKRRGCASIQEFAAKLGGMSHEKTEKILRLANQLEDKPTLKALLESGEASYSKINAVAYVATPETETAWAEKVKNVPRAALELCVRQSRLPTVNLSSASTREIDRLEVGPGANVPSVTAASFISFKISAELEFELRLIKQNLEKENGQALGFAEVLQELLKVYKTANTKLETWPESRRTVQLCPNCIKEKTNEVVEYGEPKRAIPMEVQRLVTIRQEGRCAFPSCEKPPTSFHHTRRFSLGGGHDPDFIVHLCTPHERLAHVGLIENEEQSPSQWRIREKVSIRTFHERQKFKIDDKVNAFRREPAFISTSKST